MIRLLAALLGASALASPAHAQTSDEATDVGATAVPTSRVTITGAAAILSDYRFRGVSLTDGKLAAQATITATHDSGFYAGVFASNLAGYGEVGGANVEIDLYGGYKRRFGAATVDAGLLYYLYPARADGTSVAELYANVSGTLGPGTVKLGAAYAPRQRALANVSAAPNSRGQKDDNIYVFADASAAVVGTPLTVKAHLGYSDGNPGLGPNNTSFAPTGTYIDYLVGVNATFRNLTLGVAYVGTDIGSRESLRLQPFLSKGQDGTGSIVDGTLLLSLTASF